MQVVNKDREENSVRNEDIEDEVGVESEDGMEYEISQIGSENRIGYKGCMWSEDRVRVKMTGGAKM